MATASANQPLLSTPKTSPPITLILILSVASVLCLTTLVTLHSIKYTHLNSSPVHQICDRAYDHQSCMLMASEIMASSSKTNGLDLLQMFLKKSASDVKGTVQMAHNLKNQINDVRERAALIDCVELMEISTDRIMGSIKALQKRSSNSHADAHAWLSSVLTNHVTCLDGLSGSTWILMEPNLTNLISVARNSLAVFVATTPSDTGVVKPVEKEFPSWLSPGDRKLLQMSPEGVKADVVVAKDGSGRYKTVKEAVAAAPSKSSTRYVIHVKKGKYKENVEVGNDKKNIMIVGDGMDSTIITGSLNVDDGSTTFKSATLAAVGDGFIAQDIWFQNTAGPQKHQAVALRVGADQSVINRCRIDAYQDTLYAHSNRQFYRDCSISGTIDFIFGNAAVVLQKCKIIARKPMHGQGNMVTAQGRTDPNENTGTSIQRCKIIPSTDLKPVQGKIRSYLGRPWKEYSRTVVMQSLIGDHIDPAGWSPWDGDFALKTLYYGEYLNKGPGAGTSNRVKWAGYHVITSPKEAQKFTVAELIQGEMWLKSTGVAFIEGL